MKFIEGQTHFQTCLFPVSLDKSIDENNEVRLIDLFVNSLDIADEDQEKELQEKIDKQKEHRSKYEKIEKALDETGQKQLSTSDPESRQIMIRGAITEVAYNVQSTVDAKNKLPIDYEVTNENDSRAMGNMVRRAKTILGKNDFSVLFDKGYHTGKEPAKVQQLGIKTHVAIPAVPSNSQAPNPDYNVENFIYDKHSDTYKCPANETLVSNQTWYRNPNYRFKQYKTSSCINYAVKSECTKAKNGKLVQRSEYQDAVDQNKANIKANPDLYKLRQSLVEHPFGTMKRQWSYDHIMTKKTMKHASADVGLIFIAYNLRRLLKIVGIDKLKGLFFHILLSTQSTLIKIGSFMANIANYRAPIVFQPILNLIQPTLYLFKYKPQ